MILTVVVIIILAFGFIRLLPKPIDEPSSPPLHIYCEANITAKILKPFIADGRTSEHLFVKVIEVIRYSGEPLVKAGDEINLYISGTKDLGCKDLNNDGGITIRDECENIGKPEKLYANWTVASLKSEDIIKAPMRCTALQNNQCSLWEMSDSRIEVQ